MNTITRREVAEWIFLLQQKPAKPEKNHAKLALQELVTVYRDRDDVARQSGKSINGHVGHVNAIWNFARKHGFVDRSLDNPFSEQRVKEAPLEAKEGFTAAQLQAIFNTPVFTAGERPVQGRGEAAFWIPLLLLTYGARPEEMCQLLVSDVFQDEDLGYGVSRSLTKETIRSKGLGRSRTIGTRSCDARCRSLNCFRGLGFSNT